MRKKLRSHVAAIGAAILLTGCQSADLIELNNKYIALIQQQSEIERLVKNGLGPADAETMRTGIHIAFANIGDKAMKNADAAETVTKNAAAPDKVRSRRNEASFLSVAARSYLSSGEIADHKVVAPSERGIAVCRGLTGLQSLPTTCGYFHIARHVGAYNETIRKIRPVFDRALALQENQKLPAADGKALEAAVGNVITELEALTETGSDPGKINWSEAGKGLRTNFHTQQNKFLCNAIRLQARIINAASDPTWKAPAIQRKTKSMNDRWVEELKRRPGGFERSRDCKL